MPVIVVGTDAHHRDLGVHRGEKVRIEIRRTVVRHLQYIRTQVGPDRHQVLLRLDLGITGQQDPNAIHLGTEDERGVVRVRVGAVIRVRRAEDVQPDGSDIQMRADRWRPQ